jgi:hypothetical protein
MAAITISQREPKVKFLSQDRLGYATVPANL